jgi:hypothetical protein
VLSEISIFFIRLNFCHWLLSAGSVSSVPTWTAMSVRAVQRGCVGLTLVHEVAIGGDEGEDGEEETEKGWRVDGLERIGNSGRQDGVDGIANRLQYWKLAQLGHDG